MSLLRSREVYTLTYASSFSRPNFPPLYFYDWSIGKENVKSTLWTRICYQSSKNMKKRAS
jgi:hypothetical protein